MLSDTDSIGIIQFSRNAKVILSLTKIKDTQTRDKIFNIAISSSSSVVHNGKTVNIWNALSLGISLLETNYNYRHFVPSGGNIVLITDSNMDINYPNKDSILKDIKNNHIIIDTIKLNDFKDNLLDDLSLKTEGLKFDINQNNKLFDIESSLAMISNRETTNLFKAIELFNSYSTIEWHHDGEQKLKPIYIDDFISSKSSAILRFKFSFEDIKSRINVVIYEPNFNQHKSNFMANCKDLSRLAEFSHDFNLTSLQEIVCEFRRPSSGKWQYEILNNDVQFKQTPYAKIKIDVFFRKKIEDLSFYPNYYERNARNVNKKRRHVPYFQYAKEELQDKLQNSKHENEFIKVEATWSKEIIKYPEMQAIYVSLSKNLKAIINASVRAVILRPSGDYVTVELYDNGNNADRFKDDGVYTRYFTNYNMNGIYSARVLNYN
jgi:hypothetical protein